MGGAPHLLSTVPVSSPLLYSSMPCIYSVPFGSRFLYEKFLVFSSFFKIFYSYCTFSNHFYTIIITQGFFPRESLHSITVYFSFLLLCSTLYSSTLNFNCQVALWSLYIVRLFCSPPLHPQLSDAARLGIIRRRLHLILHVFQDYAKQQQTQ